MLTKGAIGNLVNRYKAVLKKCNLINTFGSLAVASMLVMGGAGVASAEITERTTVSAGESLTISGEMITGIQQTNKTPNLGGVIYNSGTIYINNKTTFEENGLACKDKPSTVHGGAIYSDGNTAKLYIDTATFKKNSANWETPDPSYGHGGAISSTSGAYLEVRNSTFEENNAGKMSGAINLAGGANDPSKQEFFISGNIFKENHSACAGVAFINGQSGQFENNTFEGNYATGHTGAIVISGKSPKVTFTGDEFSKNYSASNAGALNIEVANAIVDITNATFTDNYTINGDGGAIYNKGKLTISGTTFDKNSADGEKMYGGAIFSNGSVTIENSTLSGNKAKGAGAFGGAIYVGKNSTGKITDTDFIGNYAENGGALATGVNTSNLTIKGGTFSENSAKASGGALGIFGTASVEGGAKVDGVTFVKNTAGFGGAAILGAESFTSFSNALFNGNEAEAEGGAIATRTAMANGYPTNLTDAGLSLSGGSFDGNIAGTMGGAVYNSFFKDANGDDSVKVSNVVFSNNSAKNGGAIYNDGTTAGSNIGGVMTIADSTFTGNSASERGGAIYNSGKLTLEGNNVFSGNTAAEGNDIYNEGDLTINGTTTFDGGVAGAGTMTVVEGSEIVLDSTAAKIENKIEGTATVSGSSKFNDQGGTLADLEAAFTNTENDDDAVKATGIAEGLIAGAVDANGNRRVNTILQDTLDIATIAPLAVGRIVMNDVRKRMGDLRDATGEAGAWMRWDGGKLKGDEGLTNNFNTIQIGADILTGIKNVRAGVAAAFTHGDLDHNNGDCEMETYSFSAYGVWMADNGMFADVIARVGFTNTELNVKGRSVDLDNEVLSLSGEYGWRLPVCSQFYVEPQVELTYTYVTEADSKIDYATYEVDSMDSLLGRAGMAFGWKLPNDRGNLYARASVVHEFLGDAKITGSALGNTEVHELDGEDTWFEYGIGVNVKLTDKTYIWADVERTEGAEIDEEWRGTVGIRFSF